MPVFAQKEYNTWYFGDSAGLTFNTDPPEAVTDGVLYTYEGTSGICDEQGNLLFYASGDEVYNKQHQLMKNGRLYYPEARTSAIQGALALPVPLHPGLYYLLSTPAQESFSMDHYLRYSVIDMQRDSGKGEVVSANIPLLPNAMETMALTGHNNGYDYWLTHTNQETGDFNSVRTVNGIWDTTTLVVQPAFAAGGHRINSMKFSPDGNTLTTGSFYESVWDTSADLVENLYLHRFDKSTGQVSAPVMIPAGPDEDFMGIAEFSSDSRFLYMCGVKTKNGLFYYDIRQYDLAVWQADSIRNSAVVIPVLSGISGLQLGPDQKIYCFGAYKDSALSVINKPGIKGTGCDYQQGAIWLKGKKLMFGGPYYPSFLFGYPRLGKDTILCQGDSLLLRHPFYKDSHILWSTGDTTAAITVTTAGTYWIRVTRGTSVSSDTIEVKYAARFKVYLGNDTTFCRDFAHRLDAGKGAKSYLWSTGDTTVSILAGQPGIYAVTVRDSNSCAAGDTITLSRVWPPQFVFDMDTVHCEYVYLNTSPVQPEMKYLWSTGDTLPDIRVKTKGKYTLTVSSLFCSVTATAEVNELPVPDPGLAADTSLCGLPQIILNSREGTGFLWSTGETTRSVSITQPGTYAVTAFNGACASTDSIRVYDECDMRFYIPNAFTPSGDGLNDVFKVYGSNIDHVSIKIWNRWGEQLFAGSGIEPSWDGTFKGSACPAGVYLYTITVNGPGKGKRAQEQTVSGTVSMLR